MTKRNAECKLPSWTGRVWNPPPRAESHSHALHPKMRDTHPTTRPPISRTYVPAPYRVVILTVVFAAVLFCVCIP
jgi:hypothetical protein